MMKIGIIGCEGRHALHFGRLFNVDKHFPGFEVTHIWGGDAPDMLADRQKETAIPVALDNWQDVIEQTEAVLILQRLGNAHAAPAEFAIRKRKPVFVDKPFTLDVREAKHLIGLAKEHGSLLTGGSTLCFDPLIRSKDARRNSFSGMIAYKADPESPHGGYAFYGSHLTDLCAHVFGTKAHAVSVKRLGNQVSSCIFYDGHHVLLNSAPDIDAPYIMHVDEYAMRMDKLDDRGCYKRGMEHFIQMIKNGAMMPEKWSELLFSVKLLSAILASLNSGKIVEL